MCSEDSSPMPLSPSPPHSLTGCLLTHHDRSTGGLEGDATAKSMKSLAELPPCPTTLSLGTPQQSADCPHPMKLKA